MYGLDASQWSDEAPHDPLYLSHTKALRISDPLMLCVSPRSASLLSGQPP